MIFVSPSQIATFKDCRRKWAYRYIDGIKTPPKKEQEFGLEGHKRTEGWLRHGKHVGTDDVGLVCQQGIKPGFMPTPASDLLIEAKLEIPVLGGRAKMIGYADCVLPPRLVAQATTLPVVHDWKFTKDLRWAMTEKELAEDSQAAVYSYWLQRKYDAAKVVVRWVYFCGRINSKSEDGRPRTPRGVKKVELTFTKADIEANWQRQLEIVEQIVETKAKFKHAKDVPPNELACDKYGGCDHRERCPLGDAFCLGSMIEQWDRTHTNPNQEVEKMSAEEVMAKLRAHKAALLAQQEAPPAKTSVSELNEGIATKAKTQPPAEPKQDNTPPPAEATTPTGIDFVSELQRQSGTVEASPAAPAAEGPNLLATLQQQSGATTINPPEAEAAAEPKVVVPKAEVTQADLEKLTDGSAPEARAMVVHEEIPPPEPALAADAFLPEPHAREPLSNNPTLRGVTADIAAQAIEMLKGGAEGLAKPPPPSGAVVETNKPAKEKKPKTTKATKPPFVLCIDAVPSKLQNGALGQVIHLSEFVEPFTKAICKGHRCEEHPEGVDHWNLIEFKKGFSVLAHHVANHLDVKGFSGVLVVDSYTDEGQALTNTLIRRADVVFRGVR